MTIDRVQIKTEQPLNIDKAMQQHKDKVEESKAQQTLRSLAKDAERMTQ